MQSQKTIRADLFAPVLPPSRRGNAVTVARLIPQLAACGVQCAAHYCSDIQKALPNLAARTDILHFMHLAHSYRGIGAAFHDLQIPYVMTQTGTDMGKDAASEPEYVRFLKQAKRIVVNHEVAREALLTRYPQLHSPDIVVVRKTIQLPATRAALPPAVEQAVSGREVIFHPAHIRRVKAIHDALDGFDLFLKELDGSKRAHYVLLLSGDVLERKYFSSLNIDSRKNVVHTTLPPEAMPTAYERASLVLNTSVVEGSPNAVLEALFHGRPVLARAIPGIMGIARLACDALGPLPHDLLNANWPVQVFENSTRSVSDLAQQLLKIFSAPERMAEMGASGKRAFAYLATPNREGLDYRALYEAALKA